MTHQHSNVKNEGRKDQVGHCSGNIRRSGIHYMIYRSINKMFQISWANSFSSLDESIHENLISET